MNFKENLENSQKMELLREKAIELFGIEKVSFAFSSRITHNKKGEPITLHESSIIIREENLL